MIVDTSVWVEFLRGTGSGAHRALEERIRSGASIGVPDVVLAEVLVGMGDDEAGEAKANEKLAERADPFPARRSAAVAVEGLEHGLF